MIFGEVVLIKFPFTTDTTAKKRPALVILDPDDGDILLARISSQPVESDFETTVAEWENAGLLLPSYVRLHKMATLQKSLIDKSLGRLSPSDLQIVREKLKEMVESLQ
jgi:mRNA interferase MazF